MTSSFWLQFDITDLDPIFTKALSKCLLLAHVSSEIKHPNPCPLLGCSGVSWGLFFGFFGEEWDMGCLALFCSGLFVGWFGVFLGFYWVVVGFFSVVGFGCFYKVRDYLCFVF